MSDQKSGGISSFGIGFGKGGAQEPPAVGERPPFRIVVLAELTPRAEHSVAAPPPDEPLAVDKLTLDRLASQLAPTFAIEVTDPFAPDQLVRVDLRFTELKSMRPDALADNVPLLRALVQSRSIVQQLADRKIELGPARAQLVRILPKPAWADALTSEVQEGRAAAPAPVAQKATPAQSGGGTGLDALFDKIDVGAPRVETAPVPMPAPDTVPNRFSDIIGKLTKSVKDDRPAPVVGKAKEKIERAFARILQDILHHPQVRRLEQSWRGLKLLVDRCDHRAGVEVDVLSTDVDGVEATLVRLASRKGEESQRAPVDLLLVDHEVRPTAAELERLERWATIAEAMRAPMIVNGGPTLLGLDDLGALASAKKRLASFEEPRALAVRNIASRDAMRWVTIAINGVVARLPYTTQAARVKDLPFAEDAADRASIVFAGAGWVVAALAAASYVRIGWPTQMAGPRHGIFENLPVYEVKEQAGTYALPLEALANTDAQAEVARAGMTLLSCAPNHDAAILARAPVLYRGKSVAAGDAPAEIALGDQLFAARVANAVEQLAAAIPDATPPAAISDVARVTMAELFSIASAPRAPEVSVRVDGAKKALEVTVRPHGFASVELEELTFSAPLGS